MLAYCDKIADVVRKALVKDESTMIVSVGNIEMDLHPEHGYFVSTKKLLTLSDFNGKVYKITIEEKVDE